ncbi:beta-galactosidase subunit beta [Streptococcus pneumoniae]|nr:beta-galactosidase subunit beta [Streptococcus pneumoniae]
MIWVELYTGEVEQLVHLRAGECLITFPEDLHQPKVRINDERKILNYTQGKWNSWFI